MKTMHKGYRYSRTYFLLPKNCHHLNPAGFLSKKIQKGLLTLFQKFGHIVLVPLSVLLLLPNTQKPQVQVLPQGEVKATVNNSHWKIITLN